MRILLAFFVAFFWTVTGVYSQTASEMRMSQKLFKDAQYHLENDELTAFKNKVAKAAKLRPKHPTLMLNYAYALCLSKEYDSAIEKLREIAQMGVYVDLSGMEVFNQLANTKGYESVSDAFDDNLAPVGKAHLILELPDPNLLVEGVAFDERSRSFFLSNVHKQKIIRYSFDNEKLSETELPYSPLGMVADQQNNCLWVSMAGIEQGNQTSGDQVGRTGIAKIDLKTNQVVDKYMQSPDSTDHLFGDLLPDEETFVYLSDSRGFLFRVDTELHEMKPVTKKGDLTSPQGLVFSGDHDQIIVADYSLGLVKVDPASGEVHTFENQTGTTVLGIDGLYRYKDELIAVQNGINPSRILKLTLNESESAIISYEILLANNPVLDDPTLGVIADKTFYFNANSQWYKFSPDYNPEEHGKRVNPKILSIPLE